MATTLEDILARAAPFLAPIAGPAPAGAQARFDPEYQAVASEVGKLDALVGAAVDWPGVARRAGELLQGRTKDLVLASYLARALQATRGAEGLATGLAILAGLMEQYWDTMQPDVKRLRGRANALQWLVEKSVLALGPTDGLAPQRDETAVLALAARRLADVARERLAAACPAFGPLLDAVQALEAAAGPPPADAQPAPPEAAPAASEVTPGPAPQVDAVAPASPASVVNATLPPPSSAADASEFLSQVRDALVEVAQRLRRAAPSDPTAYRLMRVGSWIHLAGPPPASAGRTTVPAPPERFRAQLAAAAQGSRWDDLLDLAESSVSTSVFALDLHHRTWQALGGLGPEFERARSAVVVELRAFLGRMPGLSALTFADGSPIADAQTRSWLDDVVAPRPQAVAAAEGGPDVTARLAEPRRLLLDGRSAEALAAMQAVVVAAPTGRDRFALRLEVARACAGAGLTALAKALYEELDRESRAHRLDTWEPRLAAETLKGLIAAARALDKDPRGEAPLLAEHYQRLCSLDPAAAQETWP